MSASPLSTFFTITLADFLVHRSIHPLVIDSRPFHSCVSTESGPLPSSPPPNEPALHRPTVNTRHLCRPENLLRHWNIPTPHVRLRPSNILDILLSEIELPSFAPHYSSLSRFMTRVLYLCKRSTATVHSLLRERPATPSILHCTGRTSMLLWAFCPLT